jgi:hypothetical protein
VSTFHPERVENRKLSLTGLQLPFFDRKLVSAGQYNGTQGLMHRGLIMRKTLLGRFVGILLAFLAVGSMTLLQVDQSYAAAKMQTMRVKVVLSQAQLAVLAQQNHALYAQVIKAYRTGSPLVARGNARKDRHWLLIFPEWKT